jgi:hypothetical protein
VNWSPLVVVTVNMIPSIVMKKDTASKGINMAAAAPQST